MDMKRVKEIENRIIEIRGEKFLTRDVSRHELEFLLQTIKQQHDLIERYEKAIKEMMDNTYESHTHIIGKHALEANHARTD